MESDEIIRKAFPTAIDGYERRSVDAHLIAVAAYVDSLRARIEALGVEIDALRADDAVDVPEGPLMPAPVTPTLPVRKAAEAGPADAGLSDDPVSARLVASKLFLDGIDRDAIVDRLSSEYRLDDPGDLVDEVIEGLS